MKYKDFVLWANERACDGCWDLSTAIYCIDCIKDITKQSRWKREKYWKNNYEEKITAILKNKSVF